MAEKFDPKDLVTIEGIAISNMFGKGIRVRLS